MGFTPIRFIFRLSLILSRECQSWVIVKFPEFAHEAIAFRILQELHDELHVVGCRRPQERAQPV